MHRVWEFIRELVRAAFGGSGLAEKAIKRTIWLVAIIAPFTGASQVTVSVDDRYAASLTVGTIISLVICVTFLAVVVGLAWERHRRVFLTIEDEIDPDKDGEHFWLTVTNNGTGEALVRATVTNAFLEHNQEVTDQLLHPVDLQWGSPGQATEEVRISQSVHGRSRMLARGCLCDLIDRPYDRSLHLVLIGARSSYPLVNLDTHRKFNLWLIVIVKDADGRETKRGFLVTSTDSQLTCRANDEFTQVLDQSGRRAAL